MSNRGNNSGSVLASLLAGAAVGVVLGLIFAPEEGKKTRKKLRIVAEDWSEQAREQYGKTAEMLKDQYHKTADKVKEQYHKYKEQASHSIADAEDDIQTELDGLK